MNRQEIIALDENLAPHEKKFFFAIFAEVSYHHVVV